MNTREHLNKFTQEEQKEIVRIIEILDEQRKNKGLVGAELLLLFDYWHKLFPKQKQNMKCNSCRKAVYKFFGLLAKDYTKMIEIG